MKAAILIDGDSIEIHKADGAVAMNAAGTVTPQPMSLMEQLFLVGKGQADKIPEQPAGPSDKPQGERETRQTIALQNGQHYDIAGGTVRKVVELTGTGAVQLHVKAEKAGKLRLQLAGKTSGGVTGEAGLIEPGKAEREVGRGNLDSFDVFTGPLNIGDIVTLSLNKTGGDDTTLFVINPQ